MIFGVHCTFDSPGGVTSLRAAAAARLYGALVAVARVVVVVVVAAPPAPRAPRAPHHARVHLAEHAARRRARRAQPLRHRALVVVRDLVHSVDGAGEGRLGLARGGGVALGVVVVEERGGGGGVGRRVAAAGQQLRVQEAVVAGRRAALRLAVHHHEAHGLLRRHRLLRKCFLLRVAVLVGVVSVGADGVDGAQVDVAGRVRGDVIARGRSGGGGGGGVRAGGGVAQRGLLHAGLVHGVGVRDVIHVGRQALLVLIVRAATHHSLVTCRRPVRRTAQYVLNASATLAVHSSVSEMPHADSDVLGMVIHYKQSEY